MTHKVILPPPELSRYIRFFWTLQYTGIAKHDSVFKVFARKYPRMVFQHHDGSSGIYNNNGYLPVAYLGGINSLPYDCGIHPTISLIGVSFFPHAVKPIFGIDACELHNELPDASHFVSRCLVDRLFDAKTVKKKINVLSAFFTRQLHINEYPDKLCESAWKILLNNTDETVVQKLASHFNISERNLQRRFKYNIGLAPKQFLRINRFESAIRLLQAGEETRLTDIAYELNYADQSHFIREFRQFANVTPTQYLGLKKVYEENSAFIVKQGSNDDSGK